MSNIGKFTLRKDKPIVYNLSVYNESPDCRRVDDYRNYLVSKIERKLIPNFPEREGSRRTNMFESREVGIGATREVAEREEKEKLKKIQVILFRINLAKFTVILFYFLVVEKVRRGKKSKIHCRSTEKN